jgi:hypothetical protein
VTRERQLRSRLIETGVLRLGNIVPDFSCDTTQGEWPSFHEWLGTSWGILFSHPADFTPVCTTEIGRLALKYKWFTERDVKVRCGLFGFGFIAFLINSYYSSYIVYLLMTVSKRVRCISSNRLCIFPRKLVRNPSTTFEDIPSSDFLDTAILQLHMIFLTIQPELLSFTGCDYLRGRCGLAQRLVEGRRCALREQGHRRFPYHR